MILATIPPEETWRWLENAKLIVGGIAVVIVFVIFVLKTFVTRYEFNKLAKTVERLSEMSGKLTPEAEEQLMKVLRKLSDFADAHKPRK